MTKKVKVRFAPSPTGALHIGGVRTALFNYLFAKKHGGEFLLRIEDTDQKRFVAGAEKYIIDSLRWLGIMPDDGVNSDGSAKYRQSEREYKSFIDILIANGSAYYAFDTAEELDVLRKTAEANSTKFSYDHLTRSSLNNSLSMTPDEVRVKLGSGSPYVIRFKVPQGREVKFTDAVKGSVVFSSDSMDDKILFKSDGLPTYHLANVVDDHLMEITDVIRGDEWLSSAPLHILLYEAFGWDAPNFCHLPLILGPDGKKLSKRHGDKYGFPDFPMTWDYINEDNESVHITGFKDEGYEPDALVNFIALLGWNPGGTKEIMTVDEMVDLFDLNRINNSGAMFDVEKLKSFNAHYLRKKDNSFLYSSYIEYDIFVKRDKIHYSVYSKFYSDTNKNKIIEIAKERAVFNNELYGKVSYFFEPVVLNDGVGLKNPDEFRGVMKCFTVFFSHHEDNWTAAELEKFLTEECESRGFKIGKILPDLRLALTGGAPGPDLPTTMYILGRKETLTRIQLLLIKTEKVAV